METLFEVLVVWAACIALYYMGRKSGREDAEWEAAEKRRRDRAVVDLDPGVQKRVYQSRCYREGHEPEVLDGVDTCIICGAFQLPDGSWESTEVC